MSFLNKKVSTTTKGVFVPSWKAANQFRAGTTTTIKLIPNLHKAFLELEAGKDESQIDLNAFTKLYCLSYPNNNSTQLRKSTGVGKNDLDPQEEFYWNKMDKKELDKLSTVEQDALKATMKPYKPSQKYLINCLVLENDKLKTSTQNGKQLPEIHTYLITEQIAESLFGIYNRKTKEVTDSPLQKAVKEVDESASLTDMKFLENWIMVTLDPYVAGGTPPKYTCSLSRKKYDITKLVDTFSESSQFPDHSTFDVGVPWTRKDAEAYVASGFTKLPGKTSTVASLVVHELNKPTTSLADKIRGRSTDNAVETEDLAKSSISDSAKPLPTEVVPEVKKQLKLVDKPVGKKEEILNTVNLDDLDDLLGD